VTFLTKAICRRAGLDYEQVVAEQMLGKERPFWRRPRAVAGYGVHFRLASEPPHHCDLENDQALMDGMEYDSSLSESLRAATEDWNLREPAPFHLTHASFEGWTLGHTPGDFIYFSRPAEALPHLPEIAATESFDLMMEYRPAAEQGRALDRFLGALPMAAFPEGVSLTRGAIRITYFQP